MWLHTMEGVQVQSEAVRETHSLSRLQGPFFACPKLWWLLWPEAAALQPLPCHHMVFPASLSLLEGHGV